MYCHQCGQPLPAGGRFCPNCGTPVTNSSIQAPPAPPPPAPPPSRPQPAAYAPSPLAYAPPPPAAAAYAPPPPPQAYAPPAPAYAPPPAAYAPPPQAAPHPSTERLLYYQSAVRTKVPGRSFWNYDILITEHRLLARKTGWAGNLTKGMAHSGAGGLINALAATALYSLDVGMSKVKTPKYHDAPIVPVAEVEAFRAKADGAVEFRFAELGRCIFRKGGFLSASTLVLQSPQGELLSEVMYFKELQPILSQLLGPRCVSE